MTVRVYDPYSSQTIPNVHKEVWDFIADSDISWPTHGKSAAAPNRRIALLSPIAAPVLTSAHAALMRKGEGGLRATWYSATAATTRKFPPFLWP